MAESMLGFLNADCRHMNNKRYLRYKKRILKNFYHDKPIYSMAQHLIKEDIELLFSRVDYEYDKGDMIFSDWSEGFIEGYLIAKYGEL